MEKVFQGFSEIRRKARKRRAEGNFYEFHFNCPQLVERDEKSRPSSYFCPLRFLGSPAMSTSSFTTLRGEACHMSRLYSRIVRSEEK
jgi:hypothetical protein